MEIKVNVKVELDDLIQRYFKNNPNENYDTLLEEILISRLAAISAADLIE